jgi:GNAT superfamily N-acetyltransferase
MELSAQAATLEEILPWRDMYRHEMNCQVVHDSLHARPGWTNEYFLFSNGARVGYGSVVLGGPWKGKPSIFEFFVQPSLRAHVFDLFSALVRGSGAEFIDVQTNDIVLTVMLHSFAQNISAEKILFHDKLTTNLPSHGAIFRPANPDDSARQFPHQHEPEGEWVLEFAGTIAATGGIMYHYNRPYGDIYMEVAEPFRRQGFGSYLVQEIKRICYEGGSIPVARCNPTNVASRGTLQKAGFVPCGNILTGEIIR